MGIVYSEKHQLMGMRLILLDLQFVMLLVISIQERLVFMLGGQFYGNAMEKLYSTMKHEDNKL